MLAVFDDEEQMLHETAVSLASSMAVRNPHDLDDVDREKAWRQLAGSGLLSLRARAAGEQPDGSGVDVMIVAAALGGVLAPVPFAESAILVTELLSAAGADEAAAGVADGSQRYGLALDGRLSGLATESGLAQAVGWGIAAGRYALALSDDRRQLLRVTLAAPGEPLDGADLTRPLTRLAAWSAEPIGALAPAAFDRWLALALVCACADAQGALHTAVRLAVDYARQRTAFGRPIGSFQVLQHMLADDLVAADTLHTATSFAAWAVDEAPCAEAMLAARTAKAYLGEVGLRVAEDVMQLFGGIGQTWEHIAHFYTRRVMLDQVLFGAEHEQLARIADMRLGVPAQ